MQNQFVSFVSENDHHWICCRVANLLIINFCHVRSFLLTQLALSAIFFNGQLNNLPIDFANFAQDHFWPNVIG